VIIEEADSFLPFRHTYITSHDRKNRIPSEAFNRNRPYLLPFSAHDMATLKKNIAAYSRVSDTYDLLDLSYTLFNRRTQLQSRAFIVASHASLDTCFSDGAEAFHFAEKKRCSTVGFVFTGQGAQWAKMGSELMTYYPSFLRSIRVLDKALKALVDSPDWTIEDTLLQPAEISRINEAEFSQPLCTAIQIAIVQLLERWGIRPVVTVGHSSGEIGAAFTAGLISATEAIIVAYYRGKVVSDITTRGTMMTVGLGADRVELYLENMQGKVLVACHNSAASVTLSGDVDALEIVKSRLDADNIFVRFVKTGGKAYHSHHMKPVAANYAKLVQRARTMLYLGSPPISDAVMVSSVSNTKLGRGTIIDEQYWISNLCSPVLFNQAIQTVAVDSQFGNVDVLIEIGPHSALSGPIRQICGSSGFDKLEYLPTLLRGTDSASQLLRLAGDLFLRDYPLDTERITLIEEHLPSGKVHHVKGSVIVDLPAYQWNYAKNFWAEPRRSREHRALRHARHDILGARMIGGSMSEPIWRNVLRIDDVPWIQHHSLGSEVVFPAAGYFSMAMEAITQLNEDSPSPTKIDGYVLRDVSINAALVVPNIKDGVEVICSMKPSIFTKTDTDPVWWDFNISSISETGYGHHHVEGSIAINARKRGQVPKRIPNFAQRASGKAWNQALREVGFDYGPTFQDMAEIRFDGRSYSAACKTVIKSACGIMEGESRYVLHPSTVDSCLQLIIVSIYAGRLNDMTCGAVPIKVDEVAIWLPTAEQLKSESADVYSWADQRGIRSFVTGSQLTAKNGELLMDISDMRCTAYEAAMPQKVDKHISSKPFAEMKWMYDIRSLTSSSDLRAVDVDQLIELAVFKNPALKVLEIGSKRATAILSKWKFLDYTCTEPSDRTVEEVGSVLREWENARIQSIDFSQSLVSQNIVEHSFDLIIISKEMFGKAVLESIHHLLTPRGHSILETSERLSTNVLQNASLSGIELCTPDMSKPALVLCTAFQPYIDEFFDGAQHEVQLVYRKKPAVVLTKVKKQFETLGWQVTVTRLEDYRSKAGDHTIMLVDLEGPLLATLEEGELAAIQNITGAASAILWVSCGGLLTGKIPEYSMAVGLARSIASEQNSLDLAVLDFDLENTSAEDVTDIIITIARRQRAKFEPRESEYYVSRGMVYITRLMPSDDVNRIYAFDKEETHLGVFDPAVPLVGKVLSGKVVFQADMPEDGDLEADHVEVKVSVSGLNKEDVLVVSGSDYPTNFSHEIGGIVRRVGKSVVDLEIGDHVFGFSFSKFATIQRMSASLVQKVEEEECLLELISLPMAYGNALYGLKDLARLEAQENVLILSGTGHPGLAAIKVTQLMNATPYVAVNTQAEATMIMANFNLNEQQILMSSELSVIAELKLSTGGRGPDVVFSSGSVSEHVARECWRHIEPLGRFVDSGRKNALKRSALDTVPLHRGASYLSFDILGLYGWKPQALGNLLRLTASLYRQGSITPMRPVTVKMLSELDGAISSFSDNFAAGKTLILHEPSDTPLNVLNSRPSLSLRADATYLLVGCLGGLGRSLTSWMMKKGARRFAFLSRSGTNSKQAETLVKDIEAAGVTVQVIRGDVTVMTDVERAVMGTPPEYPIRGVVQAAMVLKVGMPTI
jgi:malonyl CoA-acyl carrier protein transacylase/NADPH:quinone reductase-like Zn-dependent oxidoreductase